MTANGRHLALSGRRGTPPDWVEMSRAALGGRIELDPMSEPVFNQIVRAERILTAEDDCFTLLWRAATVFLNPHGGLVVETWRKLTHEHRSGHVGAAIWIGFSMEQLNLLADQVEHPMDFSMLVVRGRIDFLTTEPMRNVVRRVDGIAVLDCGHEVEISNKKHATAKAVRCSECEGTPDPLGSPTHANYIVGMGIPADRFEAAFAGRGRFSHGQFAIGHPLVVNRASGFDSRMVHDDEQFGGTE